MNPIIRLCNLAMVVKLDEESNETKEINKILKTIGVQLSPEDKKLVGKPLMKKIFQKWINIADAIVDMVIMKLPSPMEAQSYRASHLYQGPLDDVTGKAI